MKGKKSLTQNFEDSLRETWLCGDIANVNSLLTFFCTLLFYRLIGKNIFSLSFIMGVSLSNDEDHENIVRMETDFYEQKSNFFVVC